MGSRHEPPRGWPASAAPHGLPARVARLSCPPELPASVAGACLTSTKSLHPGVGGGLSGVRGEGPRASDPPHRSIRGSRGGRAVLVWRDLADPGHTFGRSTGSAPVGTAAAPNAAAAPGVPITGAALTAAAGTAPALTAAAGPGHSSSAERSGSTGRPGHSSSAEGSAGTAWGADREPDGRGGWAVPPSPAADRPPIIRAMCEQLVSRAAEPFRLSEPGGATDRGGARLLTTMALDERRHPVDAGPGRRRRAARGADRPWRRLQPGKEPEGRT